MSGDPACGEDLREEPGKVLPRLGHRRKLERLRSMVSYFLKHRPLFLFCPF